MAQSSICRWTVSFCVCCTLCPALWGQRAPDPGPASASTQRTWRDVTGKFEVTAQLIELSADKAKLKKADGRIVEVQLSKLSQADLDYLEAYRKQESAENPFAGGELAGDMAASGTSTPAARGELQDTAAPLELYQGDLPTGLKETGSTVSLASYGGFTVAETDAYDELSTPVLVDAATGTVAVSIGRHQIDKPQEARGRIFLGKLPQGPAQLVFETAEGLILFDHHAASDRSVLVSGFDGLKRGGDLVILAGLGAGKPHEVYRYKLPGADKPGFKPKVEWARILDDQHVAAIVNNRLNVWNFTSGAHVYCVDRVNQQQPPTLSPERKLLGIPSGPGVTIVQAVDGKSVGHVPFTGSLTPGAVFHPDGTRIAICADNRVVVFNVESGHSEVDVIVAEHLSGPLGWVGEHLLLAQSGTLVDTELGMGVWNYSLGGQQHAVTATGSLLMFGGFQKGLVAALQVPHAAAKASIDKLRSAGDKMFLVQPGSIVAVDVHLIPGVDREPVLAALRTAVERAGWKVADQAPITVVAQIGRGAAQQLRFSRAGIPHLFTQPSDISEATLTPFTADLEIRKGETVLWQRKTENFVPFTLYLEEGETVQQAVSKFERPDPAFFARLNFPPRIPLAEVSDTIGLTSLDGIRWKDLPLDIVNRVRKQRTP